MHKYEHLPTPPQTGFRNDLVTANTPPLTDSGTIWLLRIDLVVCTGEGRCTISDIDASSTKFIVQWFSRLNVGTVRQKWKGPNSKECSSFHLEKEKLSVTNFALEDFELVFFTVQSAKNRGGNQEIPNRGRA